MEIRQLPGQFVYDAVVVLPRKRKETRKTFSGTTVYEIACVDRADDPVGELVFTVNGRKDPGTGEHVTEEGVAEPGVGFWRPGRQVRFAEYGGRLWKRAGNKAPVEIEQYSGLLRKWADRDSHAGRGRVFNWEAGALDPIFNSVAPRQSPDFRAEEADTDFIGKVIWTNRVECEARFLACARDVLFIDGALHYPVPTPVWQCIYENGPVVALVEVRNGNANDSSHMWYAPRGADPQNSHVFWDRAFAVDRKDDAVKFFMEENPSLTVVGSLDAMPPGYVPVSPLAYDIATSLLSGLLDTFPEMTHLLSAEAFAAWKRLADLRDGITPTSLGPLAVDPLAAARDIIQINREIEGRFLSVQDLQAYGRLDATAATLEEPMAFETTRQAALRDEEAIASLGQ